jgi:RNA-dependent RNA polymerase
MELDLKYVSFEADVYDVRKAVALVLHGPDLYDPNDKANKGRVPNFEVVMGKSPAGRHHNGVAILRVTKEVGIRLLRWQRESETNRIVVHGKALRTFNNHRDITTPGVKDTLEKALYVDPDRDKRRSLIEDQSKLVRLRVTHIQFGVWYKSTNSESPSSPRRRFSIEYELDFLSHSAAYISIVYGHKLIHIDVSLLYSCPSDKGPDISP